MLKLSASEIANLCEMRKQNISIKEIAKKVGMGVGTVHKYVSHIKLDPAAVKELNATGYNKSLAKLTPEQRSKRNKKAGLTRAAEGEIESLKLGNRASGLTYREDEKLIKEKLDEIFSTKFRKEEINGRYFDFVDDKYLIEHTSSPTHGPYRALERFMIAIEAKDPRQMIAYIAVTQMGPKRIRAFEELNIKVLDVSELVNYKLRGVDRTAM